MIGWLQQKLLAEYNIELKLVAYHTDNSSKEFKCAQVWHYSTCTAKDMEVNIMNTQRERVHCKGDYDPEGGKLKAATRKALRQGKDIRDPEKHCTKFALC